jgi:hypothetical protein
VRGRYVFRIEFRLPVADADLGVAPDTFSTVLHRRAPPPGEDGWRYFRRTCWRGELSNPEHFRETASEALGVQVEAASFSELHVDAEYHAALREAVADDLAPFNADDVDEALTKYLGSSIRVEPVE